MHTTYIHIIHKKKYFTTLCAIKNITIKIQKFIHILVHTYPHTLIRKQSSGGLLSN